MSYCKKIQEKYQPYLGAVYPYDGAFVWKGYYLSSYGARFHGISFDALTQSDISDEKRHAKLNKYLVRLERETIEKSRRYSYSSSAMYNTSTTYITFGGI